MDEKRHSCERCREWLMDILYPEELERIPEDIREHARTCEECRREIESLEVTLRTIRKVDLKMQPPPGLEGRIMEAVEREAGMRRAPQAAGFFDVILEKVRRFIEVSRPVVANPAFAAAMIVLVVAGFLLLLKDSLVEGPWRKAKMEEEVAVEPVEPQAARQEPPEFVLESAPMGKRITGELDRKAGVLEEEPEETGVEAEEKVPAAGQERYVRDIEETAKAREAPAGELKALGEKYDGLLAKDEAAAGAAKEGKKGALHGLGAAELDDKAGSGKAATGWDEDYEAGESTIELLTPLAEGATATDKTGKESRSEETDALLGETAAKSKAAAPPVAGGASGMPAPAPSPAPKAEAQKAEPGKKAPGVSAPSYYGGVEMEEEAPPPAEAPADLVQSAPGPVYADEKEKGESWLEKWKEKRAGKKAAKKARKAKKSKKKEAETKTAAPASNAAAPESASATAKLEEKLPQDPYAAARQCFTSGDYDKALELLNSILKNPSSTTTSTAYVYHLLAKVWKKKGNRGKALAYYESLFARYPSYVRIDRARWEAALLYIAEGDSERAVKLLEKLLQSSAYKEKAEKKLESLK